MPNKFVWKGRQVSDGVRRAVEKGMRDWGDEVTDQAKARAHVITGTLQRSLHTAPGGYDGSGDESVARGQAIGSGGIGGLAGVPNWDGETAVIDVGSWVSYAIHEMRRGGAHDFLSDVVGTSQYLFEGKLASAMRREGF